MSARVRRRAQYRADSTGLTRRSQVLGDLSKTVPVISGRFVQWDPKCCGDGPCDGADKFATPFREEASARQIASIMAV